MATANIALKPRYCAVTTRWTPARWVPNCPKYTASTTMSSILVTANITAAWRRNAASIEPLLS